jgi:hypothetical protein
MSDELERTRKEEVVACDGTILAFAGVPNERLPDTLFGGRYTEPI